MEVYMRIGLLVVTAVVLFLIVFEYRGRRRPLKLSNEEERDFLIHNETDFNLKEDFAVEPTLEFVASHASKEPRLAYDKSTIARQAHNLLVLSVIAKPDQYFVSYDLIQAISAAGLQFGDMNIFHYYDSAKMNKETLFSLASATEPGDFDIDHIGDFSCAGLTLFMDINAVVDPMRTFELMLTTAQQLADDLDGELRAGHKQVWTNELLQEYQNKIMKFKSNESMA